MAEKKKRKGRRSYLNDFYTDVSGNIVYNGRMLTYHGELPYPAARLRIGIYCGLVFACVFAVACLPAPSMLGFGKTYVILPFILEVIGLLLVVWAAVRMLYHGESLREYVYEASAKKLPWWLEMTAFFAAASAVCNVIYVALNGFGGQVVLSLLVVALHILAILFALLGVRFLRKITWSDRGEELPPPESGK